MKQKLRKIIAWLLRDELAGMQSRIEALHREIEKLIHESTQEGLEAHECHQLIMEEIVYLREVKKERDGLRAALDRRWQSDRDLDARMARLKKLETDLKLMVSDTLDRIRQEDDAEGSEHEPVASAERLNDSPGFCPNCNQHGVRPGRICDTCGIYCTNVMDLDDEGPGNLISWRQ